MLFTFIIATTAFTLGKPESLISYQLSISGLYCQQSFKESLLTSVLPKATYPFLSITKVTAQALPVPDKVAFFSSEISANGKLAVSLQLNMRSTRIRKNPIL